MYAAYRILAGMPLLVFCLFDSRRRRNCRGHPVRLFESIDSSRFAVDRSLRKSVSEFAFRNDDGIVAIEPRKVDFPRRFVCGRISLGAWASLYDAAGSPFYFNLAQLQLCVG
jgi:hypothetical protein